MAGEFVLMQAKCLGRSTGGAAGPCEDPAKSAVRADFIADKSKQIALGWRSLPILGRPCS
jgi:hypothetical protein